MMYADRQYDVLSPTGAGQGLGAKVTDEGLFVTDWTGFAPDCYKFTEFKNLSAADKTKANKFYGLLAQLTGKTVTQLFDNRTNANPGGDFSFAIMNALRNAAGISEQDAEALVNLTTGAALSKGFFGGWSDAPLEPSDYLDPANLKSTQYNVVIEDALKRLRKTNPGAHEYIVRLIGAKAARRKQQVQVKVSKEQKQMVAGALETGKAAAKPVIEGGKKVVVSTGKAVGAVAEGAATAIEGAGQGVKTTLGLGATILQYWPWILGGTVLVAGYIIYRNRGTIAKVASRTPQGRLLLGGG